MTFWCVYVSFDRLAFEKVVVELNGLISIFAVWVGSLYDVDLTFTLRCSKTTDRNFPYFPVGLEQSSYE
jgi:hypothetical protein